MKERFVTDGTTTEHLTGAVETYLNTSKDQLGPILANLFTDDAIVHDDGRTYVGIDAISGWTEAVAAAFSYTRTITDVRLRTNAAIVRARLEGNFPGSPIELHHHFSLAGERISALTICP